MNSYELLTPAPKHTHHKLATFYSKDSIVSAQLSLDLVSF